MRNLGWSYHVRGSARIVGRLVRGIRQSSIEANGTLFAAESYSQMLCASLRVWHRQEDQKI